MRESSKLMRKLVITGGPCAGKTSAMGFLREALADVGVPAVFVPEAATDLILSGVAPWTCATMCEFQTRVMALQLEREAADEAAIAQTAAAVAGSPATWGRDTLMICDRGICDSRAYLSAADYERALASNGLDERAALGRYDAVFHLDSIAVTNPEAYTRANNEARFENAEEAVLADERVKCAWAAHPCVVRIPNETIFEQKAENLARAVLRVISPEHGAGCERR